MNLSKRLSPRGIESHTLVGHCVKKTLCYFVWIKSLIVSPHDLHSVKTVTNIFSFIILIPAIDLNIFVLMLLSWWAIFYSIPLHLEAILKKDQKILKKN